MSNGQYSSSTFPSTLQQQVEHGEFVGRVQVAGGLVCQDDGGL